ncbi:hypothetical protein [Belliella aquatica]|uniref:Uncharacterized protein n=1 Tax=Belliella aquatica TaxID=1323734 RepID=A0ABQ1N4T4_9BACT|nr:hypothetical protein [Belliella aquatica]MCH7407473.1 hypothetical protein [Belliella aquatica]GGC53881.1 hypothetical protein GCM10010993_35360 [Belliella aquatica]
MKRIIISFALLFTIVFLGFSEDSCGDGWKGELAEQDQGWCSKVRVGESDFYVIKCSKSVTPDKMTIENQCWIDLIIE